MIPLSAQEIAADAGGKLLQGIADAQVLSVSTDSRKIVPGCLFVALVGDTFDGHGFCAKAAELGAAAILVSKPVQVPAALPVILVEDTLKGLQNLAAAHRQRWGKFVLGLTGSNGKTSTKDLCHAVLSVAAKCRATVGNLNNHIGLPLTCLSLETADEIGIFEMGMNHHGEIAPLAAISRPNAAIITNIGTAHIEHMGSREGIGEEKGMLVEALGPNGTAILNADDSFTPSLAARHTGATLTAGFAEKADIRVTNAESTSAGSQFTLTFPNQQSTTVHLALPGRHMIGNAALAAAAGWLRGMTPEHIKQGLEAATLTKGRLQIRHVAGTTFLDDSYNANPDSMLAGLRALEDYTCEGRKIAVLGRMGELGIHAEAGHQSVGIAAASERIAMVCAVGDDDSRILANAAQDAGAIVRHFSDHASCAEFLKTLSLTTQDVVFVKGSRSATMEKVIEYYS